MATEAAVQALTAALKMGTTKALTFLQPIAVYLVDNEVESVEDLGGLDISKVARGRHQGKCRWLGCVGILSTPCIYGCACVADIYGLTG